MPEQTPDLTLPDELNVPRLRFWGDRKPPKSRADMFSVRVATNAATAASAPSSGGDSSTPTGSVATLRIYGPIDSWGGWFGVSAKDVATALDDLPDDVAELRVRINSPGGEVWEGMAILNMLRAHKARAVAVVDGLAASAASVVAAGCDETVMSPGTQMMIHDASGFAYGNAETMAKAQKFLDSTSNAIASIYTESAGGSDAEWRALMVEETWYTAQEAVDAGLADRVDVVADAGDTSTAGDEPDPTVVVVDPDTVEDQFDLSMFSHAGRSHAPAPTSSTSNTPTASADGSITTQEGSPAVAFSDEQVTTMRQELGLPEDADEATILGALSEALGERAEPAASTPEVPEGHVVIPAAQLADLQAGATIARTTAEELRVQARNQFLDSVRDRYLPTSRTGWEAEYDRDPAGVRAHFEEAPVLIPTAEIGAGTDTDPTEDIDAAVAAFATTLGLKLEV